MAEEQPDEIDMSHHNRYQYCTSRPKYRDGRKLTAVKVYTLVDESRHLLVFGVPKINLQQEVKQLFKKAGNIEMMRLVTAELAANKSVQIEQFTDCYQIAFERISCARKAKHLFDRKNFYGGVLHVSYASEFETTQDVREKISARKNDIQRRLRNIQ